MSLNLTIVGNLTRDPELRFTPSGVAVVALSVAHNSRRPDGNGGYVDEETTFMECRAWRDLAENIAATLVKGDRVVVVGRTETQTWEDKADGKKRSRLVLNADAVGPDLRWATAKVAKMARSNHGPSDDPWATASTERPAGGDDEPPF